MEQVRESNPRLTVYETVALPTELTCGDWDRVLRVNLVGAANVAHAFAPPMAEAERGTLLFVASVAGQIGSQTDPPYSASKAGLINFAQCAAKDLAPFGVRVNSLCPGMVKTALNQSVYEAWAARQVQGPGAIPSYEEWAGAKVKALVPLGRWQSPEERGRDGGLPRVRGGRQRHGADDQRRWRADDAVKGPAR